jgi:hypothetical protein
MGEDMRFRKQPLPEDQQRQKRVSNSTDNSGSIFGIWNEQRRMQAEEDKIARELAETKKKAKELSRTLRKHRYGEIKQESFSKFGSVSNSASEIISKLIRKIKLWVKSHKRLAVGIASFATILFIGNLGYSAIKPDPTATLGESTSSLPITNELPREKPRFPILYPSSKSPDDFDVVRISPDGADVSYTYLDQLTVDGGVFKVTQQEIPEGFDLEKTATDFQATNIIQIDEDKVYHGYSEKGGVQSLIFTKNDKLITIRSPQKFTDDQWAGYIISLQ